MFGKYSITAHLFSLRGIVAQPLFCILLLSLLLTACGKVNLSWKEEVLLDNGDVVIFHRTALGKRTTDSIGGTGGWVATEMALELDESGSERKTMPKWRYPLVPIVVDRDPVTKQWFVVATFYQCQDWYDLGRPILPYVEYQIREGAWQVVPLEERLFGRRTNLLAGVRSSGEPSLVNLADKTKRARKSADWFFRIVKEWRTTC